MELYLVQHGFATSKDEDPERPLTDHGREEVIRVAATAKAIGVVVTAVYHSGKLRAQQTAEILGAALDPPAPPSQLDGLIPTDDPAVVARTVYGLRGSPMLVGHLPHLSRFASLLIAGDPSREVISFRHAAIVRLTRAGESGWRVRWILTPEFAGKLG